MDDKYSAPTHACVAMLEGQDFVFVGTEEACQMRLRRAVQWMLDNYWGPGFRATIHPFRSPFEKVEFFALEYSRQGDWLYMQKLEVSL